MDSCRDVLVCSVSGWIHFRMEHVWIDQLVDSGWNQAGMYFFVVFVDGLICGFVRLSLDHVWMDAFVRSSVYGWIY